MQISQIMTHQIQVASPDLPIQQAAQMMADADSGFLPVQEGERLIGTLTDRDIAIRAVAEGRGPETQVRDVMSARPLFCWDDQDVQEVAGQMSDAQVRRMPVLSRAEQRLVGVVSLGDLARSEHDDAAETALEGVSAPGREHNQS